MHSALVIVEPPTTADGEEHRFARRNLTTNLIALARHNSAIEILGGGVALITLKQGADALVDVLNLARNGKHVYRVLFFETEPAWVRSTARRSDCI